MYHTLTCHAHSFLTKHNDKHNIISCMCYVFIFIFIQFLFICSIRVLHKVYVYYLTVIGVKINRKKQLNWNSQFIRNLNFHDHDSLNINSHYCVFLTIWTSCVWLTWKFIPLEAILLTTLSFSFVYSLYIIKKTHWYHCQGIYFWIFNKLIKINNLVSCCPHLNLLPFLASLFYSVYCVFVLLFYPLFLVGVVLGDSCYSLCGL